MISRLAPWFWIGAWALAFIAGMVNVVGVLGFEHQAVTHVTGTATMLAVAFSHWDLRSALHLAGVIGSFAAGCALSGIIIQDSTLKLGRHYGVALLLESLLLFASVPLLQHHKFSGIYLASAA